MKRSKPCFMLSAILIAALIGFPFLLEAAGRGGGGFSGGSLRTGGGTVEGPRGGEVYRGPAGGTAVKAPDGAARAVGPAGGEAARGAGGGSVARGPYGGVAVKTPDGAVYAEGSRARAASDWDHFYGPGWDDAVAAAGTSGGMGFTDTLPDDATAVVVDGQKYYVSKGVYYQECFMGSDVNYCVVAAPQ